MSKEWYENGTLKSSFVFDETGKNEGNWVSYYENGTIKKESSYVGGDKHGIWKEYYPNGEIKKETVYINDKKNGLQREWKEGGHLWLQGKWALGKLIGEWETFSE